MPRTPTISNEEILAAAREVFLAQGLGASTLAIAEKAGISEASIFKRFGTKQALFLAAIGVLETPPWVKHLAPPTPAMRSELTDICTQMLDFYQEVLPRVMMMMTQHQMPHPQLMPPPPVRDTLLLTKFLEQGMAQGYLHAGNAQVIAHLLVGSIVNYVVSQNVVQQLATNAPTPGAMPVSMPMPIALPDPLPPQAFIQALIDSLWSGISP
jgi:AcrR family transcriptional regulator